MGMAAGIAFLLDRSFDDDQRSLPIHPNRIDAMFLDMRNKGQLYMPELATGVVISIYEWKERELARWAAFEKQQAAMDA